MSKLDEKLLALISNICGNNIIMTNRDIELFKSGLLDSFAFTELLVSIEENFNVIISPSEITR